ncbi:hypothetical protein B0T20DRAFT_442436 [Sordaria brevicollis]|uniref:Uncharacterized protein n=1 Tax=Sordaria brevicollis TaxID=83679 RepID=A0AAE0PAT4_SORBR|nr:hypothetical protein B0T20DRAFT_442436 [Sordaria brevicollis]
MSKKFATEILVHITAPSRSKDDATYRALANAYLDFEPTTRTSVFSKTITPNVVANDAVARPQQPIATGSIGPSTQPNQIIRSSGVAGFIETPFLSWRDAANNLASPSLRMRQDEKRDEPSQNSQLSWRPPPSVVQDSLPDNNVTLSQFCTPTRLLEDYLHPSDSSQSFFIPSPVRERTSRAQQSTAGPVQTQYEGDSTFPTISHISQRRQVEGIESRIVPPQPNRSSQGNGRERETEDNVQTALPRIITARELHAVSAASGRDSSCGQLSKQILTTAEGLPRRSLRCKTPADPRNKIIPVSPAVNANNKRRRPPSSSRESDFMIASSQPEPVPQEQVPPRTNNTILSNGGGAGPSKKPSLPSSSSPPRTESEPPPTKRPRRTSPSPEPEPTSAPTPTPAPSSSATHPPKSPSGKHLIRSRSDIGPRQDALKDAQLAARNTRLWSLLELRPPMPETADLLFDLSSAEGKQIGEKGGSEGGLITPILAKLAIDLKLTRRYRPSLQTRPLRPYERGYWLVDCSSWSRALKEECWSFLDDYLDSGVAGWGVWCTRDEGFTRMRMYCWGAVVGHIYLLLYVISKREVKYTGVEWRDGEGVVVVRVDARGRDKDKPRGDKPSLN